MFWSHVAFDNQLSTASLYPDVAAGYRFYDDIVIATMLGLVHGYLDEKTVLFIRGLC